MLTPAASPWPRILPTTEHGGTDVLEEAVGSAAERASAISRLVVQTTAEFTGRGPTKAQTQLTEYSATVLLRDILTKGEQSLVRDGNREVVLEMRRAFQQTMAPVLIAGVERITGRTVEAFLSTNHIDPDLAIETFVFAEPASGPEPPEDPEEGDGLAGR